MDRTQLKWRRMMAFFHYLSSIWYPNTVCQQDLFVFSNLVSFKVSIRFHHVQRMVPRLLLFYCCFHSLFSTLPALCEQWRHESEVANDHTSHFRKIRLIFWICTISSTYCSFIISDKDLLQPQQHEAHSSPRPPLGTQLR